MDQKNIVICSDGTGNSAVKDRGTNVFKLYESVDLNLHRQFGSLCPQVAFYDDGVGTESLKTLKALGGGVGLGLRRNVKQLYTELCRCYEKGDQIYLFGFSRGAFTVRTLAGFILECGIIDRSAWETDSDLKKLVKEAYRERRRKHPASLQKALGLFRSKSGPMPKNMASDIRFIGVWDTVDAVGFPVDWVADGWNDHVRQFKFQGLKLDERVKKACHAISIDDQRHTFHPELWDEEGESDGRIEQVWFAGVHSNVGGGYPKQGMSHVALDWMMTKAADEGLRFLPGAQRSVQLRQNVDDKMYDSRAGLGFYYRYKPRSIGEICEKANSKPKIHVSVINRIRRGADAYAPGNLPSNLQIVPTDPKAPHNIGEDLATLKQLDGKISAALAADKHALSKAPKWITARRWTHHALLLLTLFVPVSGKWIFGLPNTSAPESATATESTNIGAMVESWVSGAVPLVGNLLGKYVIRPYFEHPWLMLGIVALLFIFYCISRLGRSRIQSIYSKFWRQTLRPGPRGGDPQDPLNNEIARGVAATSP